mgnify:CR=1 FL=1
MEKNEVFLKIYRKLRMQFFVKRLSSYPYISGDTFKQFSDHIFDEVTSLNPENVKHGQVVFIKSDFLRVYFDKIHPFIKNKYIILTHNSDAEISNKYVDSKIIRWFSQNVNVRHDTITPIAIGLENLHYDQNGVVGFF